MLVKDLDFTRLKQTTEMKYLQEVSAVRQKMECFTNNLSKVSKLICFFQVKPVLSLGVKCKSTKSMLPFNQSYYSDFQIRGTDMHSWEVPLSKLFCFPSEKRSILN